MGKSLIAKLQYSKQLGLVTIWKTAMIQQKISLTFDPKKSCAVIDSNALSKGFPLESILEPTDI